MPAAKVFDQNSGGAPSSGNAMPVSLVANPLKASAKKSEKTEEEKLRDAKRSEELLAQREKIEDEIIKKLNELKLTCLKEAEITGVLPPEIYMTLHPDEPLPTVKRKVGTAFTISDDVLANIKTDDKLTLLETDIQMQKGIIAATEKMSKDKYINKSLRKKHRRDLQTAHGKLRDLQKGLTKMRLSVSKPDVSTLQESPHSGSAFSLNAQKSGWFTNKSFDPLSAKSCPTTPRGSVRDLCDERNSTCSRQWNESPSLTSMSKHLPVTTSHTSITTNTSPNDSGIHSGTAESSPPTVPSRRMTVSSNRNTHYNDNGHIYENIGYSSVQPYVSAYRQHQFPTINNFPQKPAIIDPSNGKLRTSVSAHLPKLTSVPTNFGAKSYSTSHFKSIKNNDHLASAAYNPTGRIVKKVSPLGGHNMAPRFIPESGHRLSMGNAATARVAAPHMNGKEFSTSSLDRRVHRQRQKDESDSSPSTSNGSAALASHNLTTTFPVVTALDQMTGDPIQRDLNAYFASQGNGIGYGVPHCTVNPRNHSATRSTNDWPVFEAIRDPQMEALLSYYRDGVFSKQLNAPPAHNSTPATRIVPIEQKPVKKVKGNTNGATMV